MKFILLLEDLMDLNLLKYKCLGKLCNGLIFSKCVVLFMICFIVWIEIFVFFVI